MFFIFLIPVLLLLLFRFFLFKGHFSPMNKMGDFIFSLYLTSILIGVLFYIIYPDDVSVYEPSIAAMLYLAVALAIYFFPLLYFQERKAYSLDIIDINLFKLISLFLLIGSIYSMLIFVPKAIEVFNEGSGDYRLMLNAGQVVVLDGSISNTIAVAFSAFFSFVQIIGLLVVYFRVFGSKSNFIGSLMLFSSTSYIFNAFAFAGRDGVVFWFLSFLFNYAMLKSWFGVKISSRLSKILWIIFILFSSGLIIITLSRFSSRALFSMINYFSQSITNFNDLFILNPPIYNGSLNFSVLKSYFVPLTLYSGDLNYYYLSHNVYPWVFKFFIGSLVADFGKTTTLTILFLFAFFIFIIIIRKNKNSLKVINISSLLLLSFYAQVGFMGVFYFKHLSLNNYILALFFLSLLLYSFKLLTRRSYILSKKS